MEEAIVVYMDDKPVAFTQDGRVSVLDAIRMVMDSGSAQTVWERLKREHPDILDYCESFSFREWGSVSVTDKEGWDKIWMLLPEYLSKTV